MFHSLLAHVHNGRIELSEQLELPEGARLLITLLPEKDDEFWAQASQESLASVWDNTDDDTYAQLLED